MSFNATKKRALDPSRHINVRRVAVRSCIVCCLPYSKPVGYTRFVQSLTRSHHLNNDNLSDQNIRDILSELTLFRLQSIELTNKFHQYRKNQKKQGYHLLSKKDKNYYQQILQQVSALWKKFDTDT